MDEEIGPQHNGPLQLKRTKANGWTKARRAAFLEELAMSCNVRRAHAAAEMALGSAYRLRQRDPLFAKQWQEALELGYERLELALVRRALDGANCGLASPVIAADGAILHLAEAPVSAPMFPARVRLIEGCDKQLATCRDRFANAINFRGEAHLPGNDLLTRYPGG